MRHNQQRQYLPVIFIIASLLLAACGERPKTIGVINLAPGLDAAMEGFKEGLAESGYIEGENINYIYEGATNSIETLDSVAQGLVEAEVDLILSISTPATLAAQRATADNDIPVVFVPVTDPMGAGLIESFRQPGGNITGVAFGLQEGRRLEWLVQIVPTIEEIYIPYNPEDRSAVLALEMAIAAAPELGVEIITRETRTPEEVMAAIEHVPEETDAIFLLPDSLTGTYNTEFVKLQLPISGPNPIDTKRDGILMSYGIEITASGKQAARLADQIFQGVKPADLPAEMAEFHLAINLQTAETIGLNISDEILLQADSIVH